MSENPQEEIFTKDQTESDCCPHTLRIDSLCAICGEEVRKGPEMVAVSHSTDHILQTKQNAKEQQRKRNVDLEKQKKMILILDLDQTILHSSLNEDECDYSFTIQNSSFFVKFRPHLSAFLRKAKKKFEIHVYTLGTRDYAEGICRFLDPDRELFGDRIVSRSENFNKLTKSIKRISSISRNVVILDDRLDVWKYNRNLIPIRPFWYYNKIDINNPHLLAKNESQMKKTPLENEERPAASSVPNISGKEDIIEEARPGPPVEQMKNTTEEEMINESLENSEELSQSISEADINEEQRVAPPGRQEMKKFLEEADIKEEQRLAPPGRQEMKRFPEEERLAHPFILETSDDSSILKMNRDSELKRIIKVLYKIHGRYFKKKGHAKRLAKLRVFKNRKFICHPLFNNLILFAGGKIDLNNPDFSIENKQMAEFNRIPNISSVWVYECIFQRRFVCPERYIIENYDNTADIQKEFEDEFFQS